MTLRCGTRDSELSLLQTNDALARLRDETGLDFEVVPFSSPGDRDQATDLRASPGDFFTRDLDAALLEGRIDCAIHSAKDLPPEGLAEGLDWFWLPWREDPRDCLVSRVAEPRRVGVSSGRRDAWCAKRFPEAERLTLRGAIPARLAKLDRGDYDAIVVAAAALHRLGLRDRITEYIPLSELPPPPGQGVLAMTFRRDDPRLRALRGLYVKAVRFVGAGVGDAGLCTVAGLRELRAADVVVYDALLDPTLLDGVRAERLYVGKRSGAHALPQAEITALLGERARRGQRVVRLKGGDPGVFGRLAEETDALAADGIPFRVWPGVSALAAAPAATGMLLTRREAGRGFVVSTPRATGDETTDVWFMALGQADAVARRYAPETPCAIVYDAWGPGQRVWRGTVADLRPQPPEAPGLLLVGEAAKHAFPALGPLAGQRVWVTGSAGVAERAARAVVDLGGIPVVRPLVRFEAVADVKIRPSKGYNLLVVTSPTAARFLLERLVSPIQYLPKRLAVTGPATAAALAHLHIDTLTPERDFSAEGLLAALPQDLSGYKILRVRSEDAGPALAQALKARGAKVKDLPLYRTVGLPETEPPPHDAVFLASASAARAWAATSAPKGVPVIALGGPTAAALRGLGVEPAAVPARQLPADAIRAWALARFREACRG
ncbi:MAG TPA: hydroxymethylbilane synthase [Candidatus Spyradenecus faecavium]|uniref:Hydroxymethylbilane synthase n=1 Tax=Candidatus Spyradenecus faecavium TaxID=2840947 RepID=A0A9D1NMH9_9BACT|nr:hydroxymethylbilane synthase [Candidatus Spyradenecus faecavium]